MLESTTFPGWKRPGLIEAACATATTIAQRSPFPGWKRPGLIEAEGQIVAFATVVADFRGGNAPASLKLSTSAIEIPTKSKFPGWKRPGLIEAYRLCRY